MGAVHPGLQIGDRAVSPRQQLFAGRRGALAAPPVFKAALANPAVAHPPVGVHDRSGGGGSADKPGERGARGIGQDAQAQTSRAAPANLNRDPDQRLVTARTTALTPFIEATEIELVDLDLARQRLALGRDHRAPQLLQDQPRRLIARQAQLALELLRRDPRMVRGDQVRRPKPRAQRRARPVHHRPRRDRRLPATALALPDQPATVHRAGLITSTPGAHKPIGPPRCEQVLAAGLLGCKTLLEIHDRAREPRPRHLVKLRLSSDGTNRIRTWSRMASRPNYNERSMSANNAPTSVWS